jgi:hypothetical protein
MWSSETEDIRVRRLAFNFWRGSATTTDIPSLEVVDRKSQLYDEVMHQRVILGDARARPWLLEQIRRREQFWWIPVGDAAGLWNVELRDAIKAILKVNAAGPAVSIDSNTRHSVATLLRAIANAELEDVLCECWEAVATDPKFVQLALFCGTTETRRLVRRTLEENPELKAFAHLQFTYGFMDRSLQDTVTRAALDSLVPYVSLMPPGELMEIAIYCDRFGMQEWRRQNIDRFLDEGQRRLYAPDREDLFRALDEYAQQNKLLCGDTWLRINEERGLSTTDLLRVAIEWSCKQTDPTALTLAANLVASAANREQARQFAASFPQSVEPLAAWAEFETRRRTLS